MELVWSALNKLQKKIETCYLIIMKIFFALVLFFISSSTYGEIIYCSYQFSNDN